MTLEEKAKLLNEFDERHSRNWGVIRIDGKEVLGQIGPVSASVCPPIEIVFILLGEIEELVEHNQADTLRPELFKVLREFLL